MTICLECLGMKGRLRCVQAKLQAHRFFVPVRGFGVGPLSIAFIPRVVMIIGYILS